jgi:hypothetical protein
VQAFPSHRSSAGCRAGFGAGRRSCLPGTHGSRRRPLPTKERNAAKTSLTDVIAPAISLAKRGLPQDWFITLKVATSASVLRRYPESARLYLPDGLPRSRPHCIVRLLADQKPFVAETIIGSLHDLEAVFPASLVGRVTTHGTPESRDKVSLRAT